MSPSSPPPLLHQAAVLRSLGIPFIARMLEAGHRQLHLAPRTAALIADWPGDPAAAGLAMRFNGALNALARHGRHAALTSLCRHEHTDFIGAIGNAMAESDDFIARWMRDPPQTNEVARAGAIMAALAVVADTFDMPVSLLELGSSAGLNLNLAHYRYDLGGQAFGVPTSPVVIAPEWQGAPPPAIDIRIGDRRGVDLFPLDMADAAARERLSSFAWTDDPGRADRLERAMALAQRWPVAIDRADLTEWLPRQLAMPQPAGECRVIFHSMVLQYLSEAGRQDILATIAAAGDRADDRRPLAWIGFEWTPDRREVQLTLTIWPERRTRLLAICHPYCQWVRWL